VDFENRLIVISTGNKKYLSVVTQGQNFITNEGKIEFDQIKSIPSSIESSTGVIFSIYAPSYKEFILLMKRGPQIIYPKDVGSIIVSANINSKSKVLEIGTGSGALTLFLSSILGHDAKFYSLDVNKKNQYRAKKTISRYLSNYSTDFIKDINFINQDLSGFQIDTIPINFDSIITDVPEPWLFFDSNQINNDLHWVSYLPSISQVSRITDTLEENQFQDIEIKEVIEREWTVRGKISRPKHSMVGHTGFIVSARNIL
jgi:tRNA (adenine57-N1/adenine58-N1)-methyltransferase|tara:strand:+ start:17577 stop:18350 length:774 start_codon:yes stop_codon:yes gene_type:complete